MTNSKIRNSFETLRSIKEECITSICINLSENQMEVIVLQTDQVLNLSVVSFTPINRKILLEISDFNGVDVILID